MTAAILTVTVEMDKYLSLLLRRDIIGALTLEVTLAKNSKNYLDICSKL